MTDTRAIRGLIKGAVGCLCEACAVGLGAFYFGGVLAASIALVLNSVLLLFVANRQLGLNR